MWVGLEDRLFVGRGWKISVKAHGLRSMGLGVLIVVSKDFF